MIKLTHIIHLDVDNNLKPHLKGTLYHFPLLENYLDKIPNKNIIAAISFKTQSTMNPHLLEHFPNLKLLITRTAGVDHINLNACKERKIAVYNIPDYGAHNIAEHALALLLAGAKNIVTANQQTHQGKFSYEDFLSLSLNNKTLGVIGTGKIGLELIKMSKGFNMTILAFDVFKNDQAAREIGFTYVTLDKLLKNSDFISLHVPLLPQTKHMIARSELKKMKHGAVLVNTSRGAIIDEKALIEHIKKFKAVCLDVLEEEKSFSKNHPLLKFDNVIITPHIAFYSDETVKTISRETLENIKRFEQGDKTNRVV